MLHELNLTVGPGGDQWLQIDKSIQTFAENHGWPPDLDFTIRLILEELVLNAVNYGSDDQSTEVNLHLTAGEKEIRIILKDNGTPFDPFVDSPVPDLDASIEERPVGGLGVQLVQTMSDEVSYERVGNLNQVTVVKSRE